MKLTIVVLLLATTLAHAQERGANVNRDRAERVRAFRSMNYGNWVGRHILDQSVIEKIGLKEEQVKTLKEEMEKLDAKSKELDEQIAKFSIEQAEIAKKLLEEPGAKLDPVFEKIEQIGQLRIEQAKISTQGLVLIRDTLTEEQRTKAHEVIMNEGQRRFAERAGRRGPMENVAAGEERQPRIRPGAQERGGAQRPGQERPPVPGGW